MQRVSLCAISVVLCVSVLTALRRNFTTETQRTTEVHRERNQSFDPKSYYKANCAGCHGSGAEKKFNPDLPESQMIDAILNGEKVETPPDMPAFADKGINQERAKALVAYMKSLRE